MKTNFRNLTLILLVPALVLGIFTVYHSNPISKILFEIFFILIPTLYIFFNRVRLPSYIFYYILFLMFCFARFAISVIYNFEFFLDYLLIIRSQINIFLIIIIISMSHSSTKYYDYLRADYK